MVRAMVKSPKRDGDCCPFINVGYSIPMVVVSMACPSCNKPPFHECVNIGQTFVSHAAINLLTDLAILVFPLPAIRSLNLGTRQKLIIYILFLMGSL
jgi:hypothetical protein